MTRALLLVATALALCLAIAATAISVAIKLAGCLVVALVLAFGLWTVTRGGGRKA